MTAAFESSLVRIYSNQRSVIGAGFLVSQNRILTCAHVIAYALGIDRKTAEMPDQKVSLDFPLLAPKQFFTARVIFWRPVNPDEFAEDIAGLELETPVPNDARPAQLVTSDELWGHRFRVFGFPAEQNNGVWASGQLCGKLASGWVQLEGVRQEGYRLERGFSGAPIWDEELQGVAGMAVANETKRPETKAAFIIPANVLIKAWPELGEQAIPPCSPILRSKLYQGIEQPGVLIRVKISRPKDTIHVIARKITNEETPKEYQPYLVNFELANNELTSSDQLLKWFCKQITLLLNLENKIDRYRQEEIFSNTECSEYFEKDLLGKISNPLVLVLYNVELILKHQPIADNFFGLLRSWKQDLAKHDSWNKLRLVIVHSEDINTHPPFNVGFVINFPEPEVGQ